MDGERETSVQMATRLVEEAEQDRARRVQMDEAYLTTLEAQRVAAERQVEFQAQLIPLVESFLTEGRTAMSGESGPPTDFELRLIALDRALNARPINTGQESNVVVAFAREFEAYLRGESGGES